MRVRRKLIECLSSIVCIYFAWLNTFRKDALLFDVVVYICLPGVCPGGMFTLLKRRFIFFLSDAVLWCEAAISQFYFFFNFFFARTVFWLQGLYGDVHVSMIPKWCSIGVLSFSRDLQKLCCYLWKPVSATKKSIRCFCRNVWTHMSVQAQYFEKITRNFNCFLEISN